MSAEPRDNDALVPVERCPLCDAPVTPDADRCASCGMTLGGRGGRPGPFLRRDLWLSAAALGVIYLVVLAIVALIR
jgi:hypothetical protein